MRPFVEPDWADVPVNQLRVTRESELRPYLEATDPEVATGYVAEANGLLGFAPRLEPQPQSSAFLGSLRAPHLLTDCREDPSGGTVTIWVPADDENTTGWTIMWGVRPDRLTDGPAAPV
jgi:hypothetical protein